MYTHNLDPILINFGFLAIRWYSLAYICGILIGWWLGKKIILQKLGDINVKFEIKEFDNLITYLIASILIGGRFGYVLFYNFEYYISSPLEIIKIWEGGMSFHGALLGVIMGTYLFALKKKISVLFLLDIIACVSPIGIFFGRIANFINGELIGKTTNVFWSVIFPSFDNMPRHPSQLYEAFLEGLILFCIMILIILKKNYRTGTCSYMFLILYGFFRIISEFFREPDVQVGYLFNLISMGMALSAFMIIAGIIIFLMKRNDY
jgi:phosphatidylglycerol---prolipoprotein diacylglyceryl transferase